MLTREAFNALLKTLEEPPAHCIFILATTEAHKLPETIVSRTQRFNFKPGDQKTASAHLLNIAKREKIDIEPEALELLAEHGGGSFRDSISLLDQLSGLGGKITVDKARELLGLPPARAVEKLLDDIKNGDLSDAVQTIDDLRGQGVDPSMTAKALGGGLRDKLMDGDSPDWSLRLLRRLSRVASAADPQAALEIDVLEAANSNQTLKETGSVIDKEPAEDVPEESSEEAEPPTQDQVTETQNYTSAPEPVMDMKLDNWPKILDKVKAEAPSLYTALRLAEPRLENGRLVLAFQFPLHQKKVVQAKNIDLLGKIIEAMTGTKLKIECVVDKKLKLTTEKPTSTATNTDGDNDESLQAISNIFGTAEVLES